MKSVGRVSLVEAAIAELRGEIARGTWRVGDRIPSESRLAETLGVSRLSVREAVRVLVHGGLLTTRQGDGTYVTATDEARVALRRHLDRVAAMDIIDVRRGLDVVAARLAASRRTEEDLRRIREALERRAAAGRAVDAEAFADADVDFHLRIADATHNPLLADLYRSMGDVLRDSVKICHCLDQAVTGTDVSHDRLLQAVHDGDAAVAAAVALAVLDEQERASGDLSGIGD